MPYGCIGCFVNMSNRRPRNYLANKGDIYSIACIVSPCLKGKQTAAVTDMTTTSVLSTIFGRLQKLPRLIPFRLHPTASWRHCFCCHATHEDEDEEEDVRCEWKWNDLQVSSVMTIHAFT